MNARQRRTLRAVFTEPAPGNLAWRDLEALLVSLDCHTVEGAGSRVRFERNGIIASFHRPHPAKEAKRYQLRDAREFLIKIGVQP